MKFFKSVSNILFMSLVLILTVALVGSAAAIQKRNTDLDEANSRISQYKTELENKEKENSSISSQLEESENLKKKYEDENSRLKKDNDELEAEVEKQKAAAEAAAAQAKKQNTSQPAKDSAPVQTVPVKTGEKVCYLTFDDGPSENTLKILEILKKYNVKATFFVINSKQIGYVKNIYEAGHTVGLHSATHNYAKIYSSTDAYFKDLEEISNKVESIIGIKPNVIRFPGGSSNTVSKKYCKGIMSRLTKLVPEKGYYYFDWNVESGDANKNTASYTYIRNNVLNGAKNKNTACVLMHDSAAKTTTVQALPEIIEGLSKMGYRFEALSDKANGYHHRVNN